MSVFPSNHFILERVSKNDIGDSLKLIMLISRWNLPLVLWTFIFIYGMCIILAFSNKNEFRIAWMAPKKEYYNLSAYSSVGALKMALSAIRQNSEPSQIQSLHNSTIK